MTQQSEWEVFEEANFPLKTLYGPEGDKYNHAVFRDQISIRQSKELRGLPTDSDVRYLKKFGLHLRVRKVRGR